MRNLNIQYHRVAAVPGGQASAVSLDTITAHKYYAVAGQDIVAVDEQGGKEMFPVRDLPGPDNLHGFEYLALNDEFCLAVGTTLSVFNPKINPEGCDEVAFFDYPVAAMSWSPDQEIVAVVTEDLRCIVLNSVYDTLADTNLIESGEEQFVNVGWGKKETQFHGSEGKHARKAVETGVQITEGVDNSSHICWRGDGAYFVVIFTYEDRRLFKVFDKEGQLKFTSERCYGLDGPIAWRPSGLWIAVPQLLAEEQYCIALFERNGLRHRELVLPFKRSEELVTSLGWSLDSEVLMVVTKDLQTNGQKVYLYTINNYHWYLKQTLRFETTIDHVKWDPHPVNGKTLHLFLNSGEYHKFKWNFEVSSSLGQSSSDEAIVAVIDGSDVLLTNFRSFVIPPPMSSYKLTLEKEKVNAVGFIYDNGEVSLDTNQMFVLSDKNKLRLYKCTFASLNNQVTQKIKDIVLNKEIDLPQSLITYNWNMINEETLVYSTENKIHLINTSGLTDELDFADKVVHNINIIDSSNILIGLLEGSSVRRIEINSETCKFNRSSLIELFDVPLPCERHEVVNLNGKTQIYSLNPSEMLYRDGEIYLPDITSMHRIGMYLAVTTVDELKFINLIDNNATSERKIERGGLLVHIVPNDSRTVLQLPRGNLETIKPRTLSVAIVGKLLDELKYAKCYDILRKERINLNLIVDHNPDKFFTNMELFVEQINNPNWLNLFLAELRNEDVTRTMYQQQYSQLTQVTTTTGYKVTEKIEFICNRFCQVAETKFAHVAYLMLPKITSYVKRGSVETALQLIWNLKCRESGDANLTDQTTSSEMTAEEALKYLLYLVNVDDLFNVALGMYDFDLVLFVARKSQKDPKEYLSFMNGLKVLEETYRKFQIDLHLKRYERAVSNGIHCGDEHFEECLKVIRENVLFGHAMDLLSSKDARYKTIAMSYGDYLREKGKLKEAGFMYERSGDWEAALSCAQKTLQWERCLAMKRKLNATEEEVTALAELLITILTDKGSHLEASELCSTVLKDSNRFFNILVEGFLFEKAYYAARTDEDLERIKEAYESYHGQVMTSLEDDFELFRKQKLRLVQVRKEKAEKLLHPEENEYDMDCDLYSDTTSLRSSQNSRGTKSSGKSFRSSKNRRKHERKLLNLKEGNVFEDIALIDALHTVVLKLYGQQELVRQTLQAALVLNENGLGRKLQKFFKNVLEEVRNSLNEIWIPEMIVSEQLVLNEDLDLTQLQKGQHYALIQPHQRFKPLLPASEWDFEVFK